MKLKSLIFIAITSIVVAMACNSEKSGKIKNENVMQSKEDTIKRGAYLVSIMGCNDCHSPKVFGPKGPELDSTRLLSGAPAAAPIPKINKAELKNWILFKPDLTSAVGPWGMSFAANLTSDATGIGTWSEEQFITAMRKGKYKGMINNRDLLPPMPWQMLKTLKDEDIKAIFVYLKSTKPIRNIVPAPIAPNDLK